MDGKQRNQQQQQRNQQQRNQQQQTDNFKSTSSQATQEATTTSGVEVEATVVEDEGLGGEEVITDNHCHHRPGPGFQGHYSNSSCSSRS